MFAPPLFRRMALLLLVAVQGVILAGLTLAVREPATAQLMDDRFPFLQDRTWHDRQFRNQPPRENRVQQSSPGQQQSNSDFAKAPPPRRPDGPVTTRVLVFGDSMSDWLASGLEEAMADRAELGIVRKGRMGIGLLRGEGRNDGFELPQTIQETLSAEAADAIVIMVGVNDRRPIKERPARTPQAPGGDAAKAQESNPPEAPRNGGLHEFRSEVWTELYGKRVQDALAALKSKGVPVLWVGLPPIRGARANAEALYLNALFKEQAAKAQVTFIDVWDGFLDEAGEFAVVGPDLDGHIRRLRSGDGLHFTRPGARKLAHFVEREIRRLIPGPGSPLIALPKDEPAVENRPDAPDEGTRPLSGPVIILTGKRPGEQALLGGQNSPRLIADPLAARVLLQGDALPALAGRGDDFGWPRRVAAATDVIVPVGQRDEAVRLRAARAAPGEDGDGPGVRRAAGALQPIR